MNVSEGNNNLQTKHSRHNDKSLICVISAKTAAEILGVSRQHISQLVKRKRLTCLQDLHPMRFSVSKFSEETGISTKLIQEAARGVKCRN